MTGSQIVRSTLDPSAVRDLGALVASSAYFGDAREAAQAAVKIMAGAELGLGPIASMRGIDIIKGEVTLSAGAVAALVRRIGVYDYAIKRWDDSGCAIVFHRNGKPLMPVSEFGPQDAKRAGLDGQNYQRYPRNMYFARAMTNGARLHCPDLFVGAVYTSDELSDVVVDSGAPAELPPLRETDGAPEQDAPVEAPSEPPDGQADLHWDPITPEQEERLRELLRQARAEGLKSEMLRAILDGLGMGLVRIEAGWVRRLHGQEAARLIDRLDAGTADAPDDDIAF